MSHYRTQLHPWCIIRLLPDAQRITIARFRKRNDADARTLKHLMPSPLCRDLRAASSARGAIDYDSEPNTCATVSVKSGSAVATTCSSH